MHPFAFPPDIGITIMTQIIFTASLGILLFAMFIAWRKQQIQKQFNEMLEREINAFDENNSNDYYGESKFDSIKELNFLNYRTSGESKERYMDGLKNSTDNHADSNIIGGECLCRPRQSR